MSTNLLWVIHIHVGRGTNTDMPPNLLGAGVAAVVGAPDHESAAKLAVVTLVRRGFEFIDIVDRQVHQIDPAKWDTFVADNWAEFRERFPSGAEVLELVRDGGVFFGPFAGYQQRPDGEATP